ncbi:ATG C terminal domain-containing protein [Syncephalis fuscata]|nr:ATG C terminal domain-containing protein [Syncephalis fuscata]
MINEQTSDVSDTVSETFTEVTQVPLFDSETENDGGDARYLLRTYGRSKSAKLEVKLMYITVETEVYEPDQQDAFRLRLGIRDIEILDHIRTSVWHKFLTAMRPDNDSAPRESSSNMIRIDLNSVRPDPVKYKHREELRVKIRILPLRFHIDQDALNFVIQFFKVEEMLMAAQEPPMNADDSHAPTDHRSNRPYFERFELKPMMMKIDYKPKKFGLTSLREGQFLELMNVFQLDGSEITLRQVKLTGVSGVHRLIEAIQATWLPHIGYTQVSNFVSGVAPIRSMVNLGSGVADLVLLPIEQYRKDGRIIRGLQRGLQSFTKTTAMEAIKLGTKLAVGTQVLLEHADDMLSFDTPTNNGSGGGNASTFSSSSSTVTAMPGAAAMARQSSLGHSQWREGPSFDDGLSNNGPPLASSSSSLHRHHQSRVGGGGGTTTAATVIASVSPPPSSSRVHGTTTSASTSTSTSKYGEQPTSFNEGMELAYDSMKRNVGTAAHTIFAVPMEVYEKSGPHGSVKAVIRAVPVAVLRPMIGASEAFSKALMGLRNTIDPTQKLQMEDKYKSGRQ